MQVDKNFNSANSTSVFLTALQTITRRSGGLPWFGSQTSGDKIVEVILGNISSLDNLAYQSFESDLKMTGSKTRTTWQLEMPGSHILETLEN